MVSSPSLLEVLCKHGLVDSGAAHEAAGGLPPNASDERTVAWLLRRGLLTEFQAGLLRSQNVSGLVVGPFRLVDRLGEGDLFHVYLARHAPTGQAVSLKVLRQELQDDPMARKQLRQETSIVTRLKHPRFPRGIDVDPGQTYLPTDYIAGVDLQRIVQQLGPLPANQACDYIHQAALGLQHAYEQGLVHRDLKPGNILVRFEDEQVFILDMGLARLEWGRRNATYLHLTKEDLLLGTPDYVAPEQAYDPGTSDVRADIYSLGCTLFHLLTGQPPFPGGTLEEKLRHHESTPAPDLRERCPDLPLGLAQVVQTMLAKKPGARYKTPAALAAALGPFCQEERPRVPLASLRPTLPTAVRTGTPPPASDQTPSPDGKAQRLSFSEPDPVDSQLPVPASDPPVILTSEAKELPTSAKPSVAPPPAAEEDGKERRRETRRRGNLIPVLVSATPEGTEPLRGWVLDQIGRASCRERE